MRNILMVGVTALAIAACHKPGGVNRPAATASASGAASGAAAMITPPMRRSGLWEQTVTRDGKPQPMGVMRLCIDAATDAKMSLFGKTAASGLCRQQSVRRSLNGDYRFASTCSMGRAGTVKSTGTASGDFASNYLVRAEEDVSGSSFASMNGHHVTQMQARWIGPCPADMVPGDVVVGGFKMNLNTMAAAQGAVGQ